MRDDEVPLERLARKQRESRKQKAQKEGQPQPPPLDDTDAEIERLARLSMLQYERERKTAGERLNIPRLSILDALRKSKRAELGLDHKDDKQGEPIAFDEPEPWPDPVDGAALLNDLAAAARKHVFMPEPTSHGVALWGVQTYVFQHFPITPKLMIRSATKGCGKSTLLDYLAHVVARSLLASSISPAALYRVVTKHRPTMLIDEADAFIRGNEEFRGLLNASHRHDGAVIRNVGDEHEPRKFPLFAPVALAGIGSLEATIIDRSIVVDLQRRLTTDKIEPLRIGQTGHLEVLKRRIIRWVADNEERIRSCEPRLPARLFNRDADNWLCMLAIAEVAGGEWPQLAAAAALAAIGKGVEGEASLLELLLEDIRATFIAEAEDAGIEPGADLSQRSISSTRVVEVLTKMEGRPWAELGKARKPLTTNRLAKMLKPLGIAPGKVGPNDARVNGYQHWQFKEAFARYLRPSGDSKWTPGHYAANTGTSCDSKVDTFDPKCPVRKSQKPNNDGLESRCPLRKGETGETSASPIVEPCAARSPEHASDPAELCAYCGQPGGNLVALGDGTALHLHRECEDSWIETRMAEEGIWSARPPAEDV